MRTHFTCTLKVYSYREDKCCVCYLIADVSCLWSVAVGLSQLSSISPFPKLRTFYVLDSEFASVFRLKGEMGVPTHMSPLETTILNSWAFGKICIFFIEGHISSRFQPQISFIRLLILFLLILLQFITVVLVKNKVHPRRRLEGSEWDGVIWTLCSLNSTLYRV